MNVADKILKYIWLEIVSEWTLLLKYLMMDLLLNLLHETTKVFSLITFSHDRPVNGLLLLFFLSWRRQFYWPSFSCSFLRAIFHRPPETRNIYEGRQMNYSLLPPCVYDYYHYYLKGQIAVVVSACEIYTACLSPVYHEVLQKCSSISRFFFLQCSALFSVCFI